MENIKLKIMSWNHRVIATKHKDEIYFQIHEVYYDEKGNPTRYTKNPVTIGGDSKLSLIWTIDKMSVCLQKPYLDGDNWPNEYKRNK